MFTKDELNYRTIGIYKVEFLTYLEERIGDIKKITNRNIIIQCPFCENGDMYISTEIPVFKCFNKECVEVGTLRKFMRRIEGKDISEKFIDMDKLKKVCEEHKKDPGIDLDDFKGAITQEFVDELKKNFKIKKSSLEKYKFLNN